MGRVRSLEYDAVIGVGGIGAEPRSLGIDGKITWVGIHPRKTNGGWRVGPIVRFERFILFDASGPDLRALAPHLANRIYLGKVRYIVKGYSSKEQSDAEEIVRWALDATAGVIGEKIKVHKGVRVKCICKGSRRARPS